MRMRFAMNKNKSVNKPKQLKIRIENSRFCMIFILGLLTMSPVYAQSGVQEKISISSQNEKLSEILMQLSESSKLNFSYDANDPVFDTHISYIAEESLQKILDHILTNTSLTYKRIGNQIVLFQSNESMIRDAEIQSQKEVNSEVTDQNIIEEFDTPVIEMDYRLDTVFLKDTIFRVDTIRIVDTVFVEREKPEKPAPSKIKEIPVDYFQYGMEREKGWAGNIFIAPILSDFSLVENNVSFSLRSFSLGVDVIKLVNRWNFSIGLRFTQYNQKFNQQYAVSTGGNYQTDTIDVYYTIVDTDTSWYYVTDSTWIPIDHNEYNYDRSNTIGFLELNASAAYDFYKSPNLRIYGKIGGQVGWLIYKNGIAIPDSEHKDGIKFSELQFNTAYALSFGAGLKTRVTDKLDFMTELYYSRYFNQLVKEYTYDNKLNAIGLKIGLVYYF